MRKYTHNILNKPYEQVKEFAAAAASFRANQITQRMKSEAEAESLLSDE